MADYQYTELGKHTAYVDQYDPRLLCPIPRGQARPNYFSSADLPFMGVDLWTAYEFSWLNSDGLPQVAIAEFMIPCDSEAIVESKSFKLYLNSFSQTEFTSLHEVKQRLQDDLSKAVGAEIELTLYQVSEFNGFKPIAEPQGICIDQQSVFIDHYQPNSDLLQLSTVEADKPVEETLYSHLLKSNCPVTNQPDWASVYIRYRGSKIDPSGLLKYIVSYRQHQDFHEQCVEQIFMDIMARCAPRELSVFACYMRRGGLDINPYRSTFDRRPSTQFRQVRQ